MCYGYCACMHPRRGYYSSAVAPNTGRSVGALLHKEERSKRREFFGFSDQNAAIAQPHTGQEHREGRSAER